MYILSRPNQLACTKKCVSSASQQELEEVESLYVTAYLLPKMYRYQGALVGSEWLRSLKTAGVIVDFVRDSIYNL